MLRCVFVFSRFGRVWERQVGPSWPKLAPSWSGSGLGRVKLAWVWAGLGPNLVDLSGLGARLGRLGRFGSQVGPNLSEVGTVEERIWANLGGIWPSWQDVRADRAYGSVGPQWKTPHIRSSQNLKLSVYKDKD